MRDRRTSPRGITEGQAELALSPPSFRATVLAVVNASTDWTSAHDIATRAHLTYLQTIFALVALHNHDKIARTGRKATAKWGPLSLVAPASHNFNLFQSLFNSSIKRAPGIK